MDQHPDFDRPWWDIETLLKWIGEDESVGLAEIEKRAERLGLTGKLGPLDRGSGGYNAENLFQKSSLRTVC
jgi:hypothetical protein